MVHKINVAVAFVFLKNSCRHTFPHNYSNSPCGKSCQLTKFFFSFGFCCLTDWISAALTVISVRSLDYLLIVYQLVYYFLLGSIFTFIKVV